MAKKIVITGHWAIGTEPCKIYSGFSHHYEIIVLIISFTPKE